MSFTKKTWKDRQSEHPTRRVLNPTGTTNTYDVSRAEGLVMEDGEVVGSGTHTELLDTCPTYQEICMSQMNAEEAGA